MKHNGSPIIMDDEDAFGEDSRRINMSRADAGDSITRLAARYNMNNGTAMSMITDVMEEFGLADRGRAVVDFHGLVERVLLLRDSYVRQNGDPEMADRCSRLLLRLPAAAGTDTLDGLVKLLGKKKQTVNKCLKYFQHKLPELPILPGQRDAAGTKNMSRAQKKIWH